MFSYKRAQSDSGARLFAQPRAATHADKEKQNVTRIDQNASIANTRGSNAVIARSLHTSPKSKSYPSQNGSKVSAIA